MKTPRIEKEIKSPNANQKYLNPNPRFYPTTHKSLPIKGLIENQ
jgi:hypothetical protein